MTFIFVFIFNGFKLNMLSTIVARKTEHLLLADPKQTGLQVSYMIARYKNYVPTFYT